MISLKEQGIKNSVKMNFRDFLVFLHGYQVLVGLVFVNQASQKRLDILISRQSMTKTSFFALMEAGR